MKSKRRRRKDQLLPRETESFVPAKSKEQLQNQKGGAFVQTNIEIAPAHDPAEKEADQVADRVARQGNSKKSNPGLQDQSIQRQTEQEETQAQRIHKQGEEEEVSTKRIQRQEENEEVNTKRIQKKEEEEAMTKLIRKKGEEEEVQRKAESATVEKTNSGPESENSPASELSLEEMIQKSKGMGEPLPDDVRSELEASMQADFSKVRVHTGSLAIQMAAKLKAHAFTHGYDIYFNKDRFNPYTQTGRHLLAHELTHVVQQKGTS